MSLKENINLDKLPEHIAIIMDGNGRWAKKQGLKRLLGHQSGVRAVREASEGCAEIGIKHLTLYAFSTENWNRPKAEVNALMSLLVSTLKKEIATLNKNGIKLNAIGDLDSLPSKCKKELLNVMETTSSNPRMTLTLALSYSSQWEINEMVKHIARKVKMGDLDPEEITKETISNHLQTAHIPDPELLIRTSGEKRISNFLLWQIAYAELHFTDVLWPDFDREDLYEAIISFQGRERRFGKITEQLKN